MRKAVSTRKRWGLAFTSSPFPVQLQGRELQRRPHLHRSALARPMKTVVMVRAGMSVGCAVGREKESTSHSSVLPCVRIYDEYLTDRCNELSVVRCVGPFVSLVSELYGVGWVRTRGLSWCSMRVVS